MDGQDRPLDVLVVCTANICRSPMAAGLLRSALAAAGVAATVRSAGLITEGRAASEHGVSVMAARGIDIADHLSQRVSRQVVAGADLVLAMERGHVREVVVAEPAAFPHTFTLKELARRLTTIGPRPDGVAVADWVGRAAEGRRPSDLLGDDAADDVADPYGRSRRHYERTAAELQELVDAVVRHLFPCRP